MGTMYMGYYYDKVKRGLGWDVEAPGLIFTNCTKASANELVRELKRNGFDSSEISMTKNEY